MHEPFMYCSLLLPLAQFVKLTSSPPVQMLKPSGPSRLLSPIHRCTVPVNSEIILKFLICAVCYLSSISLFHTFHTFHTCLHIFTNISKLTWIFKVGKCTTSSFLMWYGTRQSYTTSKSWILCIQVPALKIQVILSSFPFSKP